MHRSFRAAVLATTALLFPAYAYAQGGIVQSGVVTRGHAPVWAGNGTLSDAGTATSSFISTLGITSAVFPSFAISTSSAVSPENILQMGVTSTGGTIDLENPGTTALPLIFENNGFPELTLDSTGTVHISSLIVGTISISSFSFANPTFTGSLLFTSNQVYNSPTIAVPSITNFVENLSGTIGGGTLSPKVPNPFYNTQTITNGVTLNNAGGAYGWHWKEALNNAVGTNSVALFELTQVNSTPADNGRTTSLEALGAYVTLNGTAGGTLPVQGSANGFVYGENTKVFLSDGALNYSLANDWGEGDIGIAPSIRPIFASGSVTIGETDTIELVSTACGFPGGIALTATAAAGDTLGILLNKFGSQILMNDTLAACGIGMALAGATSSQANTLDVTAPPNNENGPVDLTITFPPPSGGATAVYTLGTASIGASAQTKVGLTIVELKKDGVAGSTSNSVFGIAKQAGGAFPPTSGGWNNLVTFIGTTNQFSPDDTTVVPGQYPLDRLFNGVITNIPTQYAGTNDTPLQFPRMSSFLDLPNVEFLISDITTGLGPIVFPGYMLKGDGSEWIGSGTIQRLVGNAGTVGIQIQANGWEGTAIAVSNGGGPGAGTLTGRYYVNDITTCGFGDFEKVTATTATGGISTISVINDGTRFDYPSSGPRSAPSATCHPLGGSGTGAVYTITWSAGNTVTVGNSGGTVNLLGSVNVGLSATIDPGCNGALSGSTDVSGPLNVALAGVASSSGGRGTLTLVDKGGCYTGSTMITIPKGVTLKCSDSLSVIQPYETSSYGTRACSIGGKTTGAAAIQVLVTGGLSGVEVINPLITAPTSARSALTTVASYAGTGVLFPPDSVPSTGGQDALVQNVFVYGFSQCFDAETIRPWLENFGGDCTNGLKLNGVHDVGHINEGHFLPFLTTNQTWAEPVNNVSAVASNGGLVQLTIPGTIDIQAGDLVNVNQVGGRADLNNRWTVSSVANSGGNTLITLGGSSFGNFTFTGNITSDLTGNSFYIQSASSMANLANGQTITDSAAALPGGTSVSWFNSFNSVLFLSAKATSSQVADTFTVTPGTYTSGGHLVLDTNWRHGKAFDAEGTAGSQQTFLTNLFAYYFDTCWYFGLNAQWMGLNNVGCDTNQPFDPSTVAFDLESNSSWITISNSITQSYGKAVKVNTTYAPDAALIMRGSNYMEGLRWAIEENQGIALVDAEIVDAGGIFVSATSGSNLEYIGRYPFSGIDFGSPSAFANFSYHPTFVAQSIGIGPGAFSPQFPLEIANSGSDTNAAIKIETSPPITGLNDANLTFSPLAMNMNRHTGSNAFFTISTTNSGSWGAGAGSGDIVFKPGGSESVRLTRGGGLNVGAGAGALFPTGAVGMGKTGVPGSAPGASNCQILSVPGTSGGTCKLIAMCGTSTTPTTIIDNVGGGC